MGGLARRERRGFSAESAARRITSGDNKKSAKRQSVANINPSPTKVSGKVTFVMRARVVSVLMPRATAATSGLLLRRRALAAAASASTLAAAASWALCEPTAASEAPTTADYLKKADYLRDNTPEENMEALRVWKGHIQAAREQFSRKDFDLAEESLKAALEAAKVRGRDSHRRSSDLARTRTLNLTLTLTLTRSSAETRARTRRACST